MPSTPEDAGVYANRSFLVPKIFRHNQLYCQESCCQLPAPSTGVFPVISPTPPRCHCHPPSAHLSFLIALSLSLSSRADERATHYRLYQPNPEHAGAATASRQQARVGGARVHLFSPGRRKPTMPSLSLSLPSPLSGRWPGGCGWRLSIWFAACNNSVFAWFN